jgi:hypothetical protein
MLWLGMNQNTGYAVGAVLLIAFTRERRAE